MQTPMKPKAPVPPSAAANAAAAQGYDDSADVAMMEDDEEGSEEEPGAQINGEDLQKLLLERVTQLSQPELQILDQMITPQTIPVLFKIIPELGVLFEMGSQIAGAQGGAAQQPPTDGQPQPQAPAGPQQRPQEPNPLMDENVSRGLVGY